jgi:2-polyprenyl-3-methyl-5-hydroxy-6-metoxy-1,4-benzoquinol methylase
MHIVSVCPICKGSAFIKFGEAKDYTVSHETFALSQCKACEFLITSPRPEPDRLGEYYLSEEYVSHTAEAKSVFDKVYSRTREFALLWKLTLVKKFASLQPAPALLDYGCGTGFFLKRMQENGFNIAGVEPSFIARTNAQKITETKISSSIEEITTTFDVITLWHVLEHVHDLNQVITELQSRLKHGGTMFIAVPNYKSNDAKHYKMTWAGYDVPRHLWHFEEKTMTRLLQQHKLQVVHKIPMKLDALYVSMLSEKYMAGKQSIWTFARGLINGLKSNFKAKDKNYSSIIYIARHE